MGVSFTCPNCNHPVDPTKPDAMMSPSTKQWQHKHCWAGSTQPRDSSPPDNQKPA